MSASQHPNPPADEAATDVTEVDPAEESDSAYAVSLPSSTKSVESSIMKHMEENGRRYHSYKDGEYWAPNDDKQQEAEDISHEMYLRVLDGKLCLAPISEHSQRVLDLGCGTGIWAMDFADKHPSAEVLGIDLSPIQPQWSAPNCRFQVDDINHEWDFTNDFDFIHIRAMTGSVPDWPRLYTKMLGYLNPGGFVEHVELSWKAMSDDHTLPEDSALGSWWKLFKAIGEKTGKTFEAGEMARKFMIAAGFINVREQTFKVPIGPWPKDRKLKDVGIAAKHFLEEGLEGFALRGFTKALGWGLEKTQLYLAEVRKEMNNKQIHAYLCLRVVYGQAEHRFEHQ